MTFQLSPNARAIHNISFPSATQARIWKLRMEKTSTTEIANNLKASLAYISKTIRITNKKVKLIIEDVARSNFVKIDKISDVYGFAIGFSPMLNRRAFISFQPSIGVHIWYEHEGICPECPLQKQCSNLLNAEADERKISIPILLKDETERANYLIEQICSQIGWKVEF